MRSATRIALAAFAFVLWAGPAAAQNDVTFQVDLNPYITSCQFDPATDGVNTPGTMNGWDTTQFPLADADADGIYTGTYSLPVGLIGYKHFVTNNTILSWETTPDRSYTVVEGAQTIPLTTFGGPTPTSVCGGTTVNYDVTFAVDMSIQQAIGAFDPATDVVGVAGGFQSWDSANPLVLTPDSATPGLYTATATVPILIPNPVPAGGVVGTTFKFIMRPDNATVAWETIDTSVTTDYTAPDNNRNIRVFGNETDGDGNGALDYVYDNNGDPSDFPFFSDQTSDDFLSGPATVTFNVDLRPAQYRIADTEIPDPDGGGVQTAVDAITGVFINGPGGSYSDQDGGVSGGIVDWATWGPDLAALTAFQLTDSDGDGVYSTTLNYSAGVSRNLVAKFAVNGMDNEAFAPTNHNFPISTGQNTFNVQFGCMLQADGSYIDNATGTTVTSAPYDEYLIANNTVQPETCTVTRNGGALDPGETAAETAPTAIAGLAVSAAYPNPVRDAGRIDLALDRAMTVAVRVYDVMGRQVATLLDGRQVGAGTTTLDLDTSRLASGVYVLRVEADGQVASRRITVTR